MDNENLPNIDSSSYPRTKVQGIADSHYSQQISGIENLRTKVKDIKPKIFNKPRVGVGVATLIIKNNKVLMGKRHDDPEKASSALHGEGTWTIPGGKLDFGEELKEGAAREALEETGIKVNKENLKLISVGNEIVHDAHFVTLGFLAGEFTGEPRVMEPDEITEWRWFSFDNLPKPIFFPAEKVIKNYLDKEIYKN